MKRIISSTRGRLLSSENYQNLLKSSQTNYVKFWADQATKRLSFTKPFTKTVEADFKTALDKPITILVYSVYNRFLEISGKEKNCVLKYLHDL